MSIANSLYRSWAVIVRQLKKYKFGVSMLSKIVDCSAFQLQQWHILWTIQGDSKPLRQTLRVDRVNNKKHFLLNNLCLLKRRFEVAFDFC